ncbi:MAG: hypothetical protein CSB19_01035 [Clostridiales bacterium]|nr:MAG: hypothetical protein CSB19_01035 [Clostridiales bacterium]
MNCQIYQSSIFAYVRDELPQEERTNLELHIASCKDCAEALQVERAIENKLSNLPLAPLPDNFNSELLGKLKQENKTSAKKGAAQFVKRYQRQLIALAACLVLAIALMPLINNMLYDDYDMAKSEESYGGGALTPPLANEMFEEPMTNNKEVNGTSRLAFDSGQADDQLVKGDALQQRKLIKRGVISIDSENYDAVFDDITALVKGVGGYIENSNVSVNKKIINSKRVDYRHCNMALRIPQSEFDSVYNHLLTLGTTKHYEQSSEDITNRYRDTVNEVANLEVREQALRKIMDKAESISDVVTVEEELSRVRGEINNLSGTLQQWDRLVDLSTIQVNLVEIIDRSQTVQPIDDTLWSRAKQAFIVNLNRLIEALENVFIGIIGILPMLIPLIIIVTIVLVVIKNRRKK